MFKVSNLNTRFAQKGRGLGMDFKHYSWVFIDGLLEKVSLGELQHVLDQIQIFPKNRKASLQIS